MNYYIKQFLLLLTRAIVFWAIALCIFIVIRYYALGDEEGIDNSAIPIAHWLKIGIIFGTMVGVIYAIVEFAFDNYISIRLPLWLIIIQKSLIYLVALAWSTSQVFALMESELDLNFLHEGDWWLTSKIFWVLVVYYIIASLIFSFIKISNEKFGRGMFIKLLFGTYRKPKEEERIFMFLDLKSSTTIAEQLGHFKYSQFIQDCFFDLNRVLKKYDAEIYQYVGDEAVLHWTNDRGVKNQNCIKIFFAFEKRLSKNKKRYHLKYGLQPSFKAGAHCGKLIATEIGLVKKEIAFHGDVMNTTSRIQEECNSYGESLLISENLLTILNIKAKYKLNSLGSIKLKGKEQEVNLYSVNRTSA